jgi:hypothetical protein
MDNDKVFSGLNVILVEDFYQFPLVVAHRTAPLYWPAHSKYDSEDKIFG